MTIAMFGSLLGGVGLFLLGMRLMTDGLKYAAGNSLRTILERSTSTRLRGILSGAFLTALIQASGAVTVAAIGFVNAGLMKLGHAVSIVYGSNIGTTMTAWLVTMVGFDINIQAFAVPAVGIGMFMRLIKHHSRRGAFGDVLAGFGVFFIGLDILKNSFAGLGESIAVASFAGEGFLALVVFVGLGFLLTFLMQSSSASIAIILTAVAGNVIPLSDGAAAIIGANVGTTTTAALAVIGASPDAKRLAGAHVIFNLFTGVVALLVLPFMLSFLAALEEIMGVEKSVTTLLALFHTAFNVLGVLLLYPVTDSLVGFLEKRWHTVEEDESAPKYLNRNVVGTPVLAIHSMAMELKRVEGFARRMAQGAISSEKGPSERLRIDKVIVEKLLLAVGEFSNHLQRSSVPAELDMLLPNCLRVSGYFRAVAELTLDVAMMQRDWRSTENQPPELSEAIATFKKNVVQFVMAADNDSEAYKVAACQERVEELKTEYRNLKLKLLRAGSQGEIQVGRMVHDLEMLARVRRVAEQFEKGVRYLADIMRPVRLEISDKSARLEGEGPVAA